MRQERNAGMRILVTGGAGYIGSHVVRALLEAGCAVTVLDDLSTGHRWAVSPGADFVLGDIRDSGVLHTLFSRQRFDGVLHLAARSQVGESMERPALYYDVNLRGTQVLAEAMLAHGGGALVFSSSAAVYRPPARQQLLTEAAPLAPVSCYGETKRAAEALLHGMTKAHGLRVISLRYFNACGAHPDGTLGEAHDPETHLIPLILQTALGQRPRLTLYGTDYPTPDGTCVRDYVHVCDLAEAHLLALAYLLRGGASDEFNLGTGRGFSVRAVLSAAQAVTGRSIPVEPAPRRPGDPPSLVADPTRARALLHWRPRYTDLEEMVEAAWKWERNLLRKPLCNPMDFP